MTSEAPQTPSAWPYRTLFLCGHFGPATPASRRLNRENLMAMVFLALGVAAPTHGRRSLGLEGGDVGLRRA